MKVTAISLNNNEDGKRKGRHESRTQRMTIWFLCAVYIQVIGYMYTNIIVNKQAKNMLELWPMKNCKNSELQMLGRNAFGPWKHSLLTCTYFNGLNLSWKNHVTTNVPRKELSCSVLWCWGWSWLYTPLRDPHEPAGMVPFPKEQGKELCSQFVGFQWAERMLF